MRPKGTVSTDSELAIAIATAKDVVAWCDGGGLVQPRLMMSGNGAQLWFALPPISLEGERRERLQAGLKVFEATIRERVQTNTVHVDSIHDFARIIKVFGTVSHKGDGQGDRPHRVSAAIAGFEHNKDAALLARLDAEPSLRLSTKQHVSLPTVGISLPQGTAKANRKPNGEYDWEHPVEMCGPVQQLWNHGATDRSIAIFDMVRFFAHKGLGLDEITELVLEYDKRGLGKLCGRDGVRYIAMSYNKAAATPHADASIAPPSRSLLDFVKVMERLSMKGASFVSITQNFSTADAMGRLTMNVLMSFAEFEREMISERTRDKSAGARSKGKWTGGAIPFGYLARDKKLYINEPEAHVVREAFSLFFPLRKFSSVARKLNERGIFPRITKRTRDIGPLWTKDSIARVLGSPLYAGFTMLVDELFIGEQPKIIDDTTYNQAQKLLSDARCTLRVTSSNPEYVLRGILKCGCFGAAMTPASTARLSRKCVDSTDALHAKSLARSTARLECLCPQ